MPKELWKPGTLLAPVPAVLVTVRDTDGRPNVMTAAWAGTVCSDPAMVSVSIRKERYTHHILKETGEFVLNLTNRKLVRATDYCGVRSGRTEDKFAACGLHTEEGRTVAAPSIQESPIALECKTEQVLELGSHDMFLGRITAVLVDPKLLDEKGRLALEKADLIAYSHGMYFELGRLLGTFGFSVKKIKS
ncbi:MAG: flavin reductase family protein [Lachnospiraceae bacterium]|jgi:flavin reductase (DIM6/NTAB) family NADH-FMN oxidoreductase RutF|nr:flavin reductase family protein [Lachnospiraceae bacterium]MBR5339736.1 flavin reductase family protein [Lachnospiraceae bacterium]